MLQNITIFCSHLNLKYLSFNDTLGLHSKKFRDTEIVSLKIQPNIPYGEVSSNIKNVKI